MGGNDLVWPGFAIDISAKKCGIFEVKRRFALEKLQLVIKFGNPTLNQALSADGPPNGCRKCSHGCGLSLPVCAIFFENKKGFAKGWKEIVAYERRIWELFLKTPRFLTQRSFLGNRLKIEIYTDACDRSPFGKESINWESWIGIGVLVISGKVVEYSRSK